MTHVTKLLYVTSLLQSGILMKKLTQKPNPLPKALDFVLSSLLQLSEKIDKLSVQQAELEDVLLQLVKMQKDTRDLEDRIFRHHQKQLDGPKGDYKDR